MKEDFIQILTVLFVKKINSDLSIVRGFLPVHKSCIRGKVFDYLKIKELFFTKKTINLNDDEVENLFEILLLGL